MTTFNQLYRQSRILIISLSSSRKYHNLNIVHNPKIHNLNLLLTKNFAQQKQLLKCWQCGIERKKLGDLFCEQCNIIQEPQQRTNYFKIFELPVNMAIDPHELTQKYRKMQSVLHPDKFSTKSEQEKVISEEFSSLVNKAYDILQSPLKRAIHILNLNGEQIEENQTVEDPAFLMEIMELNERVENVDTDDKLMELNKINRIELEKIAATIQKSFHEHNMDQAKKDVIKMKYYSSVQSHIDKLIREKGITI